MTTQISQSEILKMNPQVSQDELETHKKMLAKLRESGVRQAGYRIAIPYNGKRVSVHQDEDARVVRLRHSSERA